MTTTTRVWDLPTRLFHWLLVGSFAGAWLTSESERLQNLHHLCGYLLLGLIGFRLLWGFVGSRHARFADFVRGPTAVLDYLRSLASGQPQHYIGHNPAGAVAILLLLALGVLTGASGWMSLNDIGGEWLEELHEGLATAMLVVAGVHVAGVIVSSLLHKENLIKAMITGTKKTPETPCAS
jgi:cytochrome b